MKETPEQSIKRKRRKKTSNAYKLKRDKKGTTWVSIEPLMKDVAEHIKMVSDLDIADLDKFDQHQYNLKLLGLNAIYTFLGALVTEQTLNEKADDTSEKQ
jgi:hypothetical protein